MTVDLAEGRALADVVNVWAAHDAWGKPAIWSRLPSGTSFVLHELRERSAADRWIAWALNHCAELIAELEECREGST